MVFSYLKVPFLRHQPEYDGLHGGHVAEPDLRDVQSAHHVGPGAGVRPLEGAILGGAQFTAL